MDYITDYRNGKYQGGLLDDKREGPGIFIDDDLTLYASHWNNNQLQGPTLLYLSHGKYIYGEWLNNKLSGLGVFRCGEIVLVGQFLSNRPTGCCLIIFQRYNFACIIKEAGKKWNIMHSGPISSHSSLIQMVQLIGVPVPEHFFSLTKFVHHFSKNCKGIRTLSCPNNCNYFGYPQGLAMIFNHNNGLVSVGKHTHLSVSEFGGCFESSKLSCQGNFQKGGERVSYQSQRPTNKIYPIYQTLHKRSINFINSYFDSKIKIFNNVEQLLRGQFQQFTKLLNKNNAIGADLNDSLDYQDYTEEQSMKLNSFRDNIYQDKQNKVSSPKTPSSYLETRKLTPRKEQSSSNIKYFRKNGQTSKISQVTPKKQKLQESQMKNKICHEDQGSPIYPTKRSPFRINRESQKTQKQSLSMLSPFRDKSSKLGKQSNIKPEEIYIEKSKVKPKMNSNHKYLSPKEQVILDDRTLRDINLPKNNNIYKQSARSHQDSPEEYKLPTFKAPLKDQAQPKHIHQHITQGLSRTNRSTFEQSPEPARRSKIKENVQIAKPSYENIQERRKRVLDQYRQINKPTPASPTTLQYQSPYQGFPFSHSKQDHQVASEVFPLSISNRQLAVSPFKNQNNQDYIKTPNKYRMNNEKYLDQPTINIKQNVKINRQSRKVQKDSDNIRLFKQVPVQMTQKITHCVDPSAKMSPSPSRPRKSYTYLYE